MDKIKIPTSFNIELEFETAEFHKRLFAWIIDIIILYCYIIIVSKLLNYYVTANKPSGQNLPFWYNLSGLVMLLYIPVLLYHLVCELTMNGQSIGKKLMRIKVISENGSRPALYQFLMRWLLRLADFGISLGLAGFISVLVSKKSQRLGDIAAGTLVIKTNTKPALSDTVFFELEDDYQPRYKDVMRLSDRDMNVIKSILDASIKHKNFELAERTSGKIRTVLNIQEYQHPVEFLETVLKDYNYLSNQN